MPTNPTALISHSDAFLTNARHRREILFITSYPPRECGIATYSDDLIRAIENRFDDAFDLRICALENDREQYAYPDQVKFVLNTDDCASFDQLAEAINLDKSIAMVVIQHEFGLFAKCPDEFNKMIEKIVSPVVTVFHTVLPDTPVEFKENVRTIAAHSSAVMVMTQNACDILTSQYEIEPEKLTVIPHGTHLTANADRDSLKARYGFQGRFVLSTFGLLSEGKSIETTLDALPDVIKKAPDVLFLVIGRTHPGVVAREGEKYREFLEQKVKTLRLESHVKFINQYLPLADLLDYLQLTDVYLFTSKDPNQAVSGTFAYAASCGCAIISTPIPPAVEFTSGDCGLIVDFQDPKGLAQAINRLVFDVELRETVRLNGLHKIVKTSWENVALAHIKLFERFLPASGLQYKLPEISLSHVRAMTTNFGMLQFCKINHPDRDSGYTLDDNSRALIALCQYYELTGHHEDLVAIRKYLDFVRFCQLPEGNFLNYVDIRENFTAQNRECNLEDSNGRAIWALGYLISMANDLPNDVLELAEASFEKALPHVEEWYSTRAMAFAIKGLYYYNCTHDSVAVRKLIRKLADRMCQMYLHETTDNWQWFESYLTYANSVLPESLLYAYKETGEETYREIAVGSFNFLLSEIFTPDHEIQVISNRNWYVRGSNRNRFGEQPIDVAYTLLALENFYTIFKDEKYRVKMERAFEWFLGRNHLGLMMYNPCTGGCHDGLEEANVNLNQGAESTLSYLLARLCMEKTGFFKKMRGAKMLRLKRQNYTFSL